MQKGVWIEGPVKNGVLKYIKRLLADEKIKAVLMPSKNKGGDSYNWCLMEKDGLLPSADPIPPIMSIQGGRIVNHLTKKGPVWDKTAVILRPCEHRAVIELAKLKQVDMTNLVVISFDCPGAYPLDKYLFGDFDKMGEAFNQSLEKQIKLQDGKTTCNICHRYTGIGADIEIGIIGAEGKGFWLIPGSPQGEVLLENAVHMGSEVENLHIRSDMVEKCRIESEKQRNEYLDSFQQTVQGSENLMQILSSCANCHNCSRVCPICFCRECYFESKALNSEADNILQRAKRKGGLRVPSDLLLFHLGRMNHMALSCVSCGACEDACPSDVPVSSLFALAARNVQAIFDYEPGRSLVEALPYTVFKHEELKKYETPYTKEYSTV